MATVEKPESVTTVPDAAAFTEWTAADLVDRFGPIPLHRIRRNPPPWAVAIRRACANPRPEWPALVE